LNGFPINDFGNNRITVISRQQDGATVVLLTANIWWEHGKPSSEWVEWLPSFVFTRSKLD
jgi:hypothetical protein